MGTYVDFTLCFVIELFLLLSYRIAAYIKMLYTNHWIIFNKISTAKIRCFIIYFSVIYKISLNPNQTTISWQSPDFLI